MYLASAYPNSALSAGALTLIAVVMACCLAFWLIMVFMADKSSEKHTWQADSHLRVAEPDQEAEDGHRGAGPASADREHSTAA